MERTFFGSTMLRNAGRAFLLATLVGSVACGGCDDDPIANNGNDTAVNNNMPDMPDNNMPDMPTNANNNLPGTITVAPTTLTVNEEGETSATFTVTLGAEPSMGDVVVDLVSGDESEATVSPAQLTLSAGTLSGTVTVTAVDDNEFDGTQTISIATNVVGQGNYAAVDAADVSVDVLDNEMISGSVNPVAITLTEDPNQTPSATIDIVLGAMPTGDVTIPISVSDDTEITVDVPSLTFTTANFSTAQTITVTAIDDAEVEPLQMLSVVIGQATGGGYDMLDLADVPVTVVDNDMATIVVTPTILATSETGTTATFDVTLGTTPTDVVNIDATILDMTEGSISGPLALDANTLTGQFTVTGLADGIPDGPQTYAITLTATSNDAAFDGLSIAQVTVTNADIDLADALVTPIQLTVNENGATSATFTVALSSDPGETVTVDAASSDATQATVAPAQISFDGTNFATPQTFTVTAVDDAVEDGNVNVTIATTLTATAAYLNVDPDDVNVLVIDDDAAGVTVTPIQGLQTTEAGGTDSFTIVLNSQPSANVTIDLSSSDTTEGTVSPASVTFTPGTWQTAQTVTITGVDDLSADGNILFQIVTAPATSTDAAYGGFDAADPFVTNADDDVPGFLVAPVTGLITSEDGTTATFDVSLLTPPLADVTIPLLVTDSTEGSAAPQTLTFTSADWNTPQTVTITGLDDTLPDGSVTYIVVLDTTSSTDTAYNNLDPPNVTVTNQDNEAGITVTPTTVTISETGSVTISVQLNSPPNQNIQLTIVDITGDEGDEYDFSPQQIVFTPLNWNTARTFTIDGVTDTTIDGSQLWQLEIEIANQIPMGQDPPYEACQALGNLGPCYQLINGTTTDSDSATVTIQPTTFGVTEGACAAVDVDLSVPSTCPGNMTFDVGPVVAMSEVCLSASNNLGNCIPPANALTVPISNGSLGNTFYVCAPDNIIAELDVTETVTVSALDCAGDNTDVFHGQTLADLEVTRLDNDTPDINIFYEGQFFFFPLQHVVTLETGADTFWDQLAISLNTPPQSSVIVTFTSTNPAEALLSDGLANTGASISLVFQPSDWNSFQFLQILGQDDALLDGSVQYGITVSVQSVDTFYDGIPVATIPGTNIDDDLPGWALVEENPPVSVNENFDQQNWLIFANTNVTQPINVTVSSSDSGEALIDGDDFVFFASETVSYFNGGGTDFCFGGPPCAVWWTGEGQPDGIADGDQPVSFSPTSMITTDPNYIATTYPTVNATVTDVNTEGINVNCTANFLPEPTMGNPNPTTTCNISTTSIPTANVDVALASDDTGEATLSTANVTLTPGGALAGVNVTLSSVTDNIDDGDVIVNISGTSTSADPNYQGQNGSDSVTITDVDDGNVVITVLNGDFTTSEGGGTVTLQVTTSTIPAGAVNIPVYTFDATEGTPAPTMIVKDASNWNQATNVVVTGQQDTENDGNVTYDVCFDIPTSVDPDYDGDPFQCITLTNLDDDFVGVTVIHPTNPDIAITDELGAADTVQFVLNSSPANDCGAGNNMPCTVEIQVGQPNASGGSCDDADTDCYARAWNGANGNDEIARAFPHTLLFTSANWDQPQTVTITGQPNGGGSGVVDGFRWFQMETTLGAQTDDFEYNDHWDDGSGSCNAAAECYIIEDVLGAHVDNDIEDLVVFGSPYATLGNGIQQALITGESGTPGTFYVRTSDLPADDVTIAFSAGAGVTPPPDFILHQGNYNQLNAFTVTGADDGNSFQAAGWTTYDMDLDATSNDADFDGLARTLNGFHSDNDSCAIHTLPVTSAISRMNVDAGDITPFIIVNGAAPLLSAVDVDATFNGNLSPNFGGVSFNGAHQHRSLHAYMATGGGAWDILFEVNNASDACYVGAADTTAFGQED